MADFFTFTASSCRGDAVHELTASVESDACSISETVKNRINEFVASVVLPPTQPSLPAEAWYDGVQNLIRCSRNPTLR